MIEIRAKKNKLKEGVADVLVHWDTQETDADIINLLTVSVVDIVNKMVEREKDVMISKKEYLEVFANIFKMLAEKEQ